MKIKYILWSIAAAVLLLALIALLPIDDELDPGAAAWGEQANDITDVEGNGYYYLMGIMAAADEDPMAVGKALIEDYRRAEQKFLNGELEEFTLQEYPAAKALGHIRGDYYCQLNESGCFARLRENLAALRRDLATHAVLLERYRRLLQFAELKPLLEPSLYERIPSFRHVIDGHRVNQLAVIVEYLSGNRAAALDELHRDMTQLRRHALTSRSLLQKMVMLSMLENDLDLLLNLADAEDARRSVPALSTEERSLRLPMQREFGGMLNVQRRMEQHPRTFKQSLSAYDSILLRTFKPNMSANEMFPYFRAVAELSEADAAEFARQAAAGSLPRSEPEFSLRNISGSIFNSIAAPSLHNYIGRAHDVDCKIALVNAALALDPAAWNKILKGEAGLQAGNPYNPEERPYVDAETQSVCFKGPLEDSEQHRCIRKDTTI